MNTELPTTTSTSSSTTLRPRNRRLISVDDQTEPPENNVSSRTTPLSSIASSLLSSRAASPIPSTHPSRSTSANRSTQKPTTNGRTLGGFNLGSQTSPSTFATGLWETSWSSLQGIASNLLGSDIAGSAKANSNSATRPPRRRRPLEATHGRKPGSAQPSQWGPPANTDRHFGSGSQEDRLARLQAKKRESLLDATGHSLPDSSGRFKRRVSEDRVSISAPPADCEDRDALVYLHHVQPNDTLAGVTIKYHCQPAVFRKANRLWPNDSIQIKKTVFLPVDACGVKGLKMPEPAESLDLLSDGSNDDAMSTPTTSRPGWGDSTRNVKAEETPLSSVQTSPSISVSNCDEPPWKHDSWVKIGGHPVPVEIARLPRKTLGFFPPSRRKSISYSELNTPTSSLDLPRNSYNDVSPRRQRQSRSSSGSYFAQQLQGPGGVGTLGKEARSPGPAQDGLNKLFAAHLPNVAPRASFESVTSNSSTGIENVGGAIEGWVRKFATRAAASVQSPKLGGRSGVGDLIELTDAFELEEAEEDRHGDGDGDTIRNIAREEEWTGASSSRDEQERMLRERFPPRGRMFEDSTSRKKGL